MSIKNFKYRLYPNRKQREKLIATLDLCRELYNGALEERIGARKNRTPTNYYKQKLQIPEIKVVRPEFSEVYSQVTQDVLLRLDKAYKSFLRRCKKGQTPGFPRFKGYNRYSSFTYPQSGFKLVGSRLQLSKIGNVRVNLHRTFKGVIKTATLKRECGAWYVTLAVEFQPIRLPYRDNAIGIDVGLESFAVLSDGTTIQNPRYYRKAQAALRQAQRRVARRKKGSHRRRKAVMILKKIHQHIANQRSDFQHKLSHQIVQDFGFIAIEDLNVKGLAGGMLAKSVHDVGWAAFFSKLLYKAENAGRTLIAIDPSGTSQTCLCGAIVRKLLSDREHVCPECGLIAPRDLVSAQVILQRARTVPSNDNVAAVSACVV